MKYYMTVHDIIQKMSQWPADKLAKVNVYADGVLIDAEKLKYAEKGNCMNAKGWLEKQVAELRVMYGKRLNSSDGIAIYDGNNCMRRLTRNDITEEIGTYELAHNCTFIRDGETWYRDFEHEIRLRDMMREIIRNHSHYDEQCDDDELLDEVLFENLMYPAGNDIDGLIAVFNMLAWSHSDLRERLKQYEDIGLTPEQVLELKDRDSKKKTVINLKVCPECCVKDYGQRILHKGGHTELEPAKNTQQEMEDFWMDK